ncbi:MAG: hypothetical protein HZC49_01945 [Nitrospirae bacterium]|nr:hypothetical protein [Nitrospirota bacterium]
MPATITLTTTPATVTIGGTVSVSATVKDSNGVNVSDGTQVVFSTNNGSIASAATVSNGVATATLNTQSSTQGTATVTVKAGSVTSIASVTVEAPLSGSIVFDAATPQAIGLRGFGQTETSLVKFVVTDINGDPVVDGISVALVMSGPGGGRTPDNGGEYIGTRDDGTPTTETVSTVDGEASVFLHSGTIAGTVTIVATVTLAGPPAVTISSSSAVMSIGGGVPSAAHFSISTTLFNLAGYTDRGSMGYVNDQSTISAFVADRFGNYNVLQGTSISFYTEAGAIDANGAVNANGATSVILRTQNPMPADIAEIASETTLRAQVLSTFGISTTYHPRDGRSTVFATVMGEEAYDDANANGIYDPGEDFEDMDEPFYDKNGDGCRNDGTNAFCYNAVTETPYTVASTDPFEIFIDANNDGQYNVPNGCWDGPNANPAYVCAARQTSKMIYQRQDVMFTGNPVYVDIVCDATDADCLGTKPSSTFAVPLGGSLDFEIIIADVNLNAPIGGTTITVTKTGSGGTLTAFVPSPIADGLSSGPIRFPVNVSGIGQTGPAIIVVEVTWKGVKYFATASGQIIP